MAEKFKEELAIVRADLALQTLLSEASQKQYEKTVAELNEVESYLMIREDKLMFVYDEQAELAVELAHLRAMVANKAFVSAVKLGSDIKEGERPVKRAKSIHEAVCSSSAQSTAAYTSLLAERGKLKICYNALVLEN